VKTAWLVTAILVGWTGVSHADDPRHDGLGGKLGVGIGMPYGLPRGFGVEIGLPHVAVIGGIGPMRDFASYAAGVRVYLHGRKSQARVHVTTCYGVTGLFQEPHFMGSWETLERPLTGVGGFLGADLDVGDPGYFSLAFAVGATRQLDLPAEEMKSPWSAGLVLGIDYRL
jgi:hypothetical protein